MRGNMDGLNTITFSGGQGTNSHDFRYSGLDRHSQLMQFMMTSDTHIVVNR